MWGRWGTPFRISFWHLLMNFEKPEKSDFWKNEKICWRYHHFTHVYQKQQSNEVQLRIYEVRHNFLSFWVIFCTFNLLSPNSPENQTFEEIKKTFGDVFILSLCNKKHHLLMYAYSDMEWSHRYNFFFHFRPFFALLPHYWSRKLTFGKNIKKHLEILSFYTCAPLIKIICTPDIWCMVLEK